MQSSSNLILVTLSVLYAETLQQQNRLPKYWCKSIDKTEGFTVRTSSYKAPHSDLYNYNYESLHVMSLVHWLVGLDFPFHLSWHFKKRKTRDRERSQLINICRDTLPKTSNLCRIRRRESAEWAGKVFQSFKNNETSALCLALNTTSWACRSTRNFRK